MSVEARLWNALREVEDPEIPISVVGMGLIAAMDFIQDDIRERLRRERVVVEVRIVVVWDPVWTRSRIREESRATMRRLGIAV